MVSFFSVTKKLSSKRFSLSVNYGTLFLILIHQNTKTATVLCIDNILEERPKVFLNISLIDVHSAYHQEAKTTEFIHFLITCR